MFCATSLAPVPKGPPVDSKTQSLPPTRPSLSRSSSLGQADLRQRPLQPTDQLRFFRQTPAQPAAHTARLNQRNPVRLTPVPGMDHAMAPRKGIQDSEAWKRVSTTAKGLTPLEVLRRVESESRDGKGLPSGGPAGPGREPPRDELLFGLRVGYLIDVRGKSGKPIDPAPIADLIKLRLQPPGGSGPQGATPTLADDQTATFAIGIAQALFARGFPPQQVHEALRGVTDLIERMPHAPDGKNDPQFQAWRKARHANCKDAFCDALLPAGLRPTAELRQSGQDLQASDPEVHTLRRLVQEREQSIESLKQVNAQVESTLAAKEKEFQQALQKLARDAEGSGSQAQQARQQAQAARQEVVQLDQQCKELQTLNASLQQQNTALQSELAALRKQLEERETGHTAQLKELEGQSTRLQEELARGRTAAAQLGEELATLRQSSQRERSDLLRQIAELQAAGKEKDLRLETLERVKGELTQQLEASKAAEAVAQEALRIAREEHAAALASQKLEFEQQLQQRDSLIADLRQKVEDIAARLDRAEGERDQAKQARDAAERTVAHQEKRLQQLRDEAERSDSALREANAGLRREVESSASTMQTQSATLQAQDGRIQDLEKQTKAQADEIRALRQQLQTAQQGATQATSDRDDAIEQLRVERAERESQVQARENHIGRQARTIEQLKAEQGVLQGSLSRLEQQAATAGQQNQLLAQQLRTSQEDGDALRLAAATSAAHIASLSNAVTQAEARMAALQGEFAQQSSRIESQGSLIQEISEKNARTQLENSQLLAELQELRSLVPATSVPSPGSPEEIDVALAAPDESPSEVAPEGAIHAVALSPALSPTSWMEEEDEDDSDRVFTLKSDFRQLAAAVDEYGGYASLLLDRWHLKSDSRERQQLAAILSEKMPSREDERIVALETAIQVLSEKLAELNDMIDDFGGGPIRDPDEPDDAAGLGDENGPTELPGPKSELDDSDPARS